MKPTFNNAHAVSSVLIVIVVIEGLLGLAPAPALASDSPTGSSVVTSGDFDNDGYDDMIVGVPSEDIRSERNDSLRNEPNVGITHVLYGREGGLSAERTQLFHRDLSVDGDRVLGDFAHSDWFGSVVATGDFDGDGFDDVAVGSPFEDRDNDPDHAVFQGSVNILYGSPTGLSTAEQDLWHQGVKGIADWREELDFFGSELAVGNFGGSSHDDLAIGVDGERLPTKEGKHGFVGAVHVLYGSELGLSTDSSQFLRQGIDGMKGRAEVFDSFGSSLAAGDFGRGAYDDLAIGSREYDKDFGNAHGDVQVVYGSTNGLDPDSGEIWHQSKPGIRGKSEPGDHFGTSLTAGDFDFDGFDDLAAGGAEPTAVEGYPGAVVHVGSVNIIRGSESGLTPDGNQIWKRETLWPEEARGSGFGGVLTAGDVGFGPEDDLVVTEGGSRGGDQVHVIPGSGSGLTSDGAQQWNQDSPDVPDEAEDWDGFGSSLTVGNFDSLHGDDVAIGVTGEDFPELIDAGGVHVLYSMGFEGLGVLGNQFWWQDSTGIPSRAEDDDGMGG